MLRLAIPAKAGLGIRRAAIMTVIAVLALLATACSGSGKSTGGGGGAPGGPTTGGSNGTAASADMVIVKNFSFSPTTLTVATGTRVTWKFEDSAQHTVSADDKSFLSPALNSEQTYSFTFAKPGTYQYTCSIHQYMKGTVIVK